MLWLTINLWQHVSLGYQFRFEQSSAKILQQTNYSFDISVTEIFWPLATGHILVMAEPQYRHNILYNYQLIEQQQIQAICMVPSALNVLLKNLNSEQRLDSLQYALICGEALALDTVQSFYNKAAGKLYNIYGPTETVIYASAVETRANDELVTIGKPIANSKFYILNEKLQPQPLGVTGEIYIGGEILSNQYLNRPELNVERFIDNPFDKGKIYKTGDLGRYLANGEIEFLGRNDTQVKVNGYRIEVSEIGAIFTNMPKVEQAAIIKDAEQNCLVAYYVGADLEIDVIIEYLAKYLPEYMLILSGLKKYLI